MKGTRPHLLHLPHPEEPFRLLHPHTSVSEMALHLISRFALSHGLRVIDALIASSAILSRAVLLTGNMQHYRFIPGLMTRRFVP